MTEIKPSDINLRLERERYTLEQIRNMIALDSNKILLFEHQINQRLSELLNILEEPISFSVPPSVDSEEAYTYQKGFVDGEEAQKKKVREVFTK